MASSSKLLALTMRSSFIRSCRLVSGSLLPTASRRPLGPLLSLRFCSAAPATVDVTADAAAAAVSSGHPWPEWGDFLEKLRGKGYFEQGAPASSASSGEGTAGDGETTPAVADNTVASEDTYPFRDLNKTKNACLKFARDRFDLLSSLPKQEILAIVKYSCPNIYRKPVNSAKRLRQFAQVKESDACSACKLRGSCDKAYVIPKDEEGARTVDVVRILLNYALDTNNLSGTNSVNRGVQESARKLLSELTVLSDSTIDPSLPKPVFQNPSKQKSSTDLSDKSKAPVANARNSVGKGRETTATEMKKGDWLCPSCNFLNFARNHHCLECKADGPKKIDAATSEMKMGDWICTQCHFMNFARNRICFKCEELRPKRQLNPGEWECSSCNFLNFARNKVCKKCNLDRPEDDTQDNKLGHRNTKWTGKSRRFDSGDKDDEDDDSPNKGVRNYAARPKLDQRTTSDKSGRTGDHRRTTARSGRTGSVDQELGLLTAKRRSARDDEDDDFVPYRGAGKKVMSRKSPSAQKRLTSETNEESSPSDLF